MKRDLYICTMKHCLAVLSQPRERHRQIETVSLFYNLYKIANKSQNITMRPCRITDFDLLPDDTDNLVWRSSQTRKCTCAFACLYDDDNRSVLLFVALAHNFISPLLSLSLAFWILSVHLFHFKGETCNKAQLKKKHTPNIISWRGFRVRCV